MGERLGGDEDQQAANRRESQKIQFPLFRISRSRESARKKILFQSTSILSVRLATSPIFLTESPTSPNSQRPFFRLLQLAKDTHRLTTRQIFYHELVCLSSSINSGLSSSDRKSESVHDIDSLSWNVDFTLH